MKKSISYIIILAFAILVVYISASGQSKYTNYKQSNVSYLVGGEHTPIIYTFMTGSAAGDTLDSAGTYTTPWVQIGYSSYVSANRSEMTFELNPEFFTVILSLDTNQVVNGDVPDSVGVSQMSFEMAYDTTATAVTAMDSTHIFMQDGNYNHPLYGQWMFEDIIGTLAEWQDNPVWMTIRVPFGGFIRFKLTHPSALSANTGVRFTLTFIAEH